MFPALSSEGVKLLEERLVERPILTVSGDLLPQTREAEHLAFGVMSLDQPVAIEKGYLPNIEFE